MAHVEFMQVEVTAAGVYVQGGDLRPTLLLPCPFCGGTDLEVNNTHTASYWVECTCGVEVVGEAFSTPPYSKSLAHAEAQRSAIEKWNTRVRR